MRLAAEWRGLDALARELATLPDRLQREAAVIIDEAAEAHAAQVRPVFPLNSVTGNLARGLLVERTGPLTRRVVNKAPHAHLYEFGFTHSAGRQVDGHDVYVPLAQDIRARMVSRLEQLLVGEATRSGVLRSV